MNANREWREPQYLDKLSGYLLHWRECLTPWEIDFLTNMVYIPSPSSKQIGILCRILNRVSKLARELEAAI